MADNREPVSPQGDTGPLYRDPVVAGGGSTLFLGWGVHGTDQAHSEAIATAPAPLSCDGSSTATTTPTATPTPAVQPQPQPLPQPTQQPKLPKAIGGFVALPKAGHCLRTRKLTFRVQRPTGFTIAVDVKLSDGRILHGKRHYKRCA